MLFLEFWFVDCLEVWVLGLTCGGCGGWSILRKMWDVLFSGSIGVLIGGILRFTRRLGGEIVVSGERWWKGEMPVLMIGME